MNIASPAFQNNGDMPSRYTCHGDNINPELRISNVPSGTKSLVLILDDPDAPMGTWDHWILFNIRPSTAVIPENSVPPGAVQGRNSWGNSEYGGPCPPSGKHRYVFKLYALSRILDIGHSTVKNDIYKAMSGSVISQAEFTGTYQKP
ncbi:MAG: YbhB/YbcL family Raf kinase inhibitor-like protein [Candidatus Aenigmarchaeota archaeon]|nr:YbhB/YbcL family Raf kinase inhibitor-like protein [Candidatus Aenigmarchaeota archaeon]